MQQTNVSPVSIVTHLSLEDHFYPKEVSSTAVYPAARGRTLQPRVIMVLWWLTPNLPSMTMSRNPDLLTRPVICLCQNRAVSPRLRHLNEKQ